MVLLFTDFGAADVYLGQVHARLQRAAPAVPIVDLLHAAPDYDVLASAHLLAGLSAEAQAGDVCMAVVDPGVGGTRDAVAIRADARWFVGPDNGLLSVVAARAQRCEIFRIVWQPPHLSVSFHGRDLFAPIAARLAQGDGSGLAPKPKLDIEFGAQDLAQIIYLDHYGNAMTGLRAQHVDPRAALQVGRCDVHYARVFADAPQEAAFWYANSLGLVEIALKAGRAADQLGCQVGLPVSLLPAH